jgi:DNA-binding CsgD family transcriptional regulator
MLGLMATPFYPDNESMEILRMLSEGNTPEKVAAKLGIKHCALRQRISRLRVNLGTKTHGQMIHEFSKLLLIYNLKQYAAKENSDAIILIKKYCNEFLPHIESFEKAMETKIENLPEDAKD